MKVIKALVLALVLGAVPLTGMAQAKKTLNPWIDCGIGAMIFDETGWAAVVSNVIWDLGTTAVTSDQASQHTCASKKAKSAAYIGATYASLSEETVKGDGANLRTVLSIMSCQPAAQREIITSIRKDYVVSLSDNGYAARSANRKAEDFYNIVSKHAQQCEV